MGLSNDYDLMAEHNFTLGPDAGQIRSYPQAKKPEPKTQPIKTKKAEVVKPLEPKEG